MDTLLSIFRYLRMIGIVFRIILLQRGQIDPFKYPDNLGRSDVSTTHSYEVWRLAKSKLFKLNTPAFQPPEGVVVPQP